MNLTPEYAERVARVLAEACNGGSWQTHYTEQHRDVWRARVAKMKGEGMTYDNQGRHIIKAQVSEIEALRTRVEELETALKSVLDACDQGRMIPGSGAGGMTIEANVRGSVFTGVPAWPIEEARAALHQEAKP